MKIFKQLITGLKISFKYRRAAWYMFLVQLLLALTIGALSYNYIQSSIGDSLNLNKILEGYQHDVIQDLLRFESTGWTMIKNSSWLAIFLYLIFGPFLMGGLINCWKEENDRWDSFWRGGSSLYLPFLRLNLIVLVFLGILAGILGAAGMFLANWGLEYFVSEVPVLAIIGGLILVLLIFGIYLISSSTNAKWIIASEETGAWKALRSGMKHMRSRFGFYLFLGLLFLLVSFTFFYLANLAINSIPESNLGLLVLVILLQLLVLLIRVFIRNAYYASILSSLGE